MNIRDELIGELLEGQDPATVMRQDGRLGALKQALMNRLMAAEFDHHRARDRADQPAGAAPNHRNGSRRKRVLAGEGSVEVTIPRDRAARFDPVLIGKYQRRLPDFDDKVIALYPRDPGPPRGAVWHQGLAITDQRGDRRGAGGSGGTARWT